MTHYEIRAVSTAGLAEGTEPEEALVYSSLRAGDAYAAANIRLTEEINKAPALTFELPPGNKAEAGGALEVICTEVRLYRKDEMIFRGRITERKRKFNNFSAYTAEGDVAWLHDVIVPGEADSVMSDTAYFAKMVNDYNAIASPYRRFVPAVVPPGAAAEEIRVGTDTYPDYYDELTDRLDLYNGGYLRTRHEKNGSTGVWTHYLDYVKTPPTGTQKIVYARNLLDLTNDDDGRDISTRLVPIGATVDKSRVRLTPAYYIDHTAKTGSQVSKYGVIEKKTDYPGAEDAATLAAYAEQDFDAMRINQKKNAIKVKAVDMSVFGSEEPLAVGTKYEVFSHPHKIGSGSGVVMQLQRAEIEPHSPERSFYWFGPVPRDSLRRIQADRKAAEETKQRQLKEASYTNAVSVSGGSTYSSQKGTTRTNGNDVATVSCTAAVSLSGWTKVDVTDKEFTDSNGSVTLRESTLEIDGADVTISGGETVYVSGGSIQRESLLYKATGTAALSRSLNNAAVVVTAQGAEKIVSVVVNGVSGTSVSLTAYALKTSKDDNELPGSITVAMIAIGTE